MKRLIIIFSLLIALCLLPQARIFADTPCNNQTIGMGSFNPQNNTSSSPCGNGTSTTTQENTGSNSNAVNNQSNNNNPWQSLWSWFSSFFGNIFGGGVPISTLPSGSITPQPSCSPRPFPTCDPRKGILCRLSPAPCQISVTPTPLPTPQPGCFYVRNCPPCPPVGPCPLMSLCRFTLVCPSGTPLPTNIQPPPPTSCVRQGTCGPIRIGQPTQQCPAGTFCTGIPAYECLPIGCHNFPICLSADTLIETDHGNVKVTDIQIGMLVATFTKDHHKVFAPVLQISHTPAPQYHHMIDITLADGREVQASAQHPLPDGRIMADLKVGDIVDNSVIVVVKTTLYTYPYTYDLLPNSDTGIYFANGIPLASTLR